MKTFNDTYTFYSSMDTVIRMPELAESRRVDYDTFRTERSGRGIADVLRSLFGKH